MHQHAPRAWNFYTPHATRHSQPIPMSERQLQFRVGVFVILAMIATVVLVFQFSSLQNRLRPKYRVAVRFRSAVGVAVGTPVRRNGVMIGAVTRVDFDDKSGGLVVQTEIRDGGRL